MGIIKAKQLVHEYIRRDEEGNVESIQTALDHIDLDVQPGQFIAILGHNGSGKSTLAKHINALLAPTEGSLWVDGKDVTQEENILPVRRTAGMVFQNPDNQIVGNTLAEDVGFGLENLGMSSVDIWDKIDEMLELTGLAAYKYSAATAATPAVDSIKTADERGFISATVERSTVWQVQTPQVFGANLYRAAAYTARDEGFAASDDNSLVEHIGYKVRLVDCGRENIKITTECDIPIAEAIINFRRANKAEAGTGA